MSLAVSQIRRREVLAALGAAGLAGAFRLEGRTPSTAQGNPDALTTQEQSLVAAIAEGIIPTTDTPGAIGAEVPAFIAMMYRDWLLSAEQVAFRGGLTACQADARAKYGKEFQACAASDQLALLTSWDKAASAVPPGAAKHPFTMLRALTIVGYYTSQVGQEQELGASMDAGLTDPKGPAIFINMLHL
jgi:hypothetical protein